VIQIESETRVLTADNVLRRVIDSEHLTADPEFLGNAGSGLSWALGVVRSLLPRAGGQRDPQMVALNQRDALSRPSATSALMWSISWSKAPVRKNRCGSPMPSRRLIATSRQRRGAKPLAASAIR
jgi:uncharacterized protein involved in exopolysaccharide biosynthesis